MLEATVQIRRSAGYGGDLCSAGSTEWVRLYLSYDGGATWEDVGLGSFSAHDIPDSVDCARKQTKPLTYTVAFPVRDPHRTRCYAPAPALPLARAILSWQVQPPAGQPNWLPIWGNRLDHHVQPRPVPLGIGDLLEILEVKTQVPTYFGSVLPKPLPEPDPMPFSLPAAAELARTADVPPHRFAAPLLGTALSERSVAQAETVANIQEFTAAGVEWSAAVTAFFDGVGDTTDEQLDCLGLDYNRDLLVGTFKINLPNGYSGPLCSPGSVEYVAFWADYDNTCNWAYVGTADVRVHDINPLPKDGLHYWVSVPANIRDHSAPCTEPKVGRVRAVLSWATPPSTTDPYRLPRWGNAIESHIEIKPRRPITDGPAIEVLGGIPITQIDTGGSGLTFPFAQFGQWGSPADPWVAARRCPFGGALTAHAPTRLHPVVHRADRQHRTRRRHHPDRRPAVQQGEPRRRRHRHVRRDRHLLRDVCAGHPAGQPEPAGTWTLVTDGTWAQCGYVVRLRVLDRSIVDSVPWGHNAGSDDVGFCLGL